MEGKIYRYTYICILLKNIEVLNIARRYPPPVDGEEVPLALEREDRLRDRTVPEQDQDKGA